MPLFVSAVMQLSEFLDFDAIASPFAAATSALCSSSWRSRRGAAAPMRRTILSSITERERLGSTGFGRRRRDPARQDRGTRPRLLPVRAPVGAGRLQGDRRPAGRPGLPAAVAARCRRRASEGAGRGQPGDSPRADARQAARRPQPRRARGGADGGRRARCRLSDHGADGDRGRGAFPGARIALSLGARSTGCSNREIEIAGPGTREIRFEVDEATFHAAGRGPRHALFQDAGRCRLLRRNSLVSDRFLLTTAFNLHFTRPMRAGEAVAEGRWVSGRRRVFVAEARIVDPTARKRARHRHVPALAHPADRPRRLSRSLMSERASGACSRRRRSCAGREAEGGFGDRAAKGRSRSRRAHC